MKKILALERVRTATGFYINVGIWKETTENEEYIVAQCPASQNSVDNMWDIEDMVNKYKKVLIKPKKYKGFRNAQKGYSILVEKLKGGEQ